MRKADAFVPRHMPSAGRNKNRAFSLFRDIKQSHLGFFELPQSLSQHRTVIIIYPIKTNMKLFTALFLAIAAQNQTPANAVELPNLRGVAGIALTDGETSGVAASAPGEETTPFLNLEDVARYNKNGAACVGSVDHHCSTAQDAKPQHKCCNSVSMDLTCAKNDTVTGPTFDGKCVDASDDVCHDFHEMKINCDGEDGGEDFSKCTSHWAYPDADANCHFICQWHFDRKEHTCSRHGGGEDEENQ